MTDCPFKLLASPILLYQFQAPGKSIPPNNWWGHTVSCGNTAVTNAAAPHVRKMKLLVGLSAERRLPTRPLMCWCDNDTDLFCSRGINLHLWWFLSQSNWKFWCLMDIITCFISFLSKATNNESSNPNRDRSPILCVTLSTLSLLKSQIRLLATQSCKTSLIKNNPFRSDHTPFWDGLKFMSSLIHRIKTIPTDTQKVSKLAENSILRTQYPDLPREQVCKQKQNKIGIKSYTPS